MPALRKPHRVAFLLPQVTIAGPDVALAHEAALLLWTACIELCQRHPGLAVYDPESTPLLPHDNHFAPQHAVIGATPTDRFFGTTRRDELVWLEVTLPRLAVRLHTLARDGARQVFDGHGKQLGDRVQQVLGAWLSARGLGPAARRFDAVTGDELIAIVRMIAPVLVEQARAWALPTAPAWSLAIDAAEIATDADDDTAQDARGLAAPEAAARPRSTLARPTASRLPASPLKVPALRLLALALREPLDDLILALDPEQPQALFARFRAGAARGPDFALLRRVIAAAPCWARPHAELARLGTAGAADDTGAPAPTALETIAGAGIAALARPAHVDVIERVAVLLGEAGLVDDGVRLLERALASHPEDARAHHALLERLEATGRAGTWLAQAAGSGAALGCPSDPAQPWYPEQIHIDLAVADALARVGRLDEAIALRASRLDGREAGWPRDARILEAWRTDARQLAWAYAREGAFRGDPARAVEGFDHGAPVDDLDLALFLDALVALGREDEIGRAWAQVDHGAARRLAVARLAAARGLLAAGEWQRGLAELWRVELTWPGRDEHVAIAHCGRLLAAAPIDLADRVIGERSAVGAATLARRMARDVADFVPAAARGAQVARALGKRTSIAFDPGSLAGFTSATHGRRVIDALFAELGPLTGDDAQGRSDRLVNRWLEAVFTEASEDDPPALAQAAAYAAGHALGRYLAATTAPPSPIAGALRTVAGEALALVRRHRAALGDGDTRALLGVVEPLLRRVDRWIGSQWLATVERSCGIDERASGDIAGFVRPHATVAARMLGPEEMAVLAASVARLHRERPQNWAAAVSVQAAQLALHTGHLGADEWADAVVAQLAAREVDHDEAIDALHTACYLVEGLSVGPCGHAARVLVDVGRAPAAVDVLSAGLRTAAPAARARVLASLAEPWQRLAPDVPLAIEDPPARRAALPPAPPRAPSREPAFGLLEAGDFAAAAALGADPRWRVRRAALVAARFRSSMEDHVEVTPRAQAAALAVLADSVALTDREAALGRALALQVREQAYFARDPVPRLGARMTRAAFLDALRARGGVARGEDVAAAPPPALEDRVVVPGARLDRASDYVALLRDLAALAPAEALAQFDLDEASYLELARLWATAIDADPAVARLIEAGLAKR